MVKDETTVLETPLCADDSVMIFLNKLKWMNTREAATYIRVSVGQLRNMVLRRQIKCYRLQNRLRFLRTDLDNVLKPSL